MTLAPLDALNAASDQFRQHLAAVRDGEWTAATPCTDWDVHFLVAHVVGGNRFAAMVLNGLSSQEAIESVMSAPQLGDDALASYDETATEQQALFTAGVARDQIVSHPMGDLSAGRFLTVRVFDVALHAWDLAVSIGHDGDLGPDLADHVLDIVLHEAPGMGFGIEPCGDVGPAATAMERLLDLCGRCDQPVTT